MSTQPASVGSKTRMVAGVAAVALLLGGGAGTVAVLFADDGETVHGAGYSYALPDGWEQVSTRGVDTAARAGDDDAGFRANVLVEVGSADGETQPEQLRSRWESNLSDAVGEAPVPIDGTTIDGHEAIGTRVAVTRDGIDLVQIVYLAINDDQVYSVAFSTAASAETEAMETFESLLGSWSWQGSQENV